MSVIDNLKRGTVELMLLTLLKNENMYGYQLSQELAARSDGLFTLQEGSMYPTLYRLTERGYVTDQQVLVGKRRTRVYYHITPEGLAYLDAIRNEYFLMHKGILNLMAKSEEDMNAQRTV